MLLQLEVEPHEEDMEGLFFSGVGDLCQAVLELGDVGVWVLRNLFHGAKSLSVFDVGTTERVLPYPVPFELFPVRLER